LALAVSLGACGGKETENKTIVDSAPNETVIDVTEQAVPSEDAETDTQASPETEAVKIPSQEKPSDSNMNLPVNEEPPSEAVELAQNIFYYDTINLEGDSGDGLSPADAAMTLLNTIPDYFVDTGDTVSITLYGLEFIGDGECYLYSVEDGNGAVSRYAVDYATGAVYVLLEESGEYQSLDSDSGDAGGGDPGDSNIPNWWGEYIGDGFSILINNFDGDSFSFAVSNLRNGEYIFEGTAAIDPDDDHMAIYGDVGFYLYEDISAIDFLTSESGEWAHLRGQYTQN
jgi:hypothetical protein